MDEIRCEKCNGLISGTSKSTCAKKCICPPETELKGWICPVCGTGLSPFMSYCPCKDTGTISVFPEILHFEHKPNIIF